MLIVRKKSVRYNVIAFQMNENVFNCNNKNTTHISLYREWNKNKIDRKKNPNEKSIEMYGFFYQFVMSANCCWHKVLSTFCKMAFQMIWFLLKWKAKVTKIWPFYVARSTRRFRIWKLASFMFMQILLAFGKHEANTRGVYGTEIFQLAFLTGEW